MSLPEEESSGLNHTTLELRLRRQIAAEKMIKEVALDLSVLNAENIIFERCLNRAAKILDSRLLLLFSDKKLYSFWSEDDFLQQQIRSQLTDSLADQVAEVVLRCRQDHRLGSKQDIGSELKQIPFIFNLCKEWNCELISSHSDDCILLISLQPEASTELLPLLGELCSTFGLAIRRVKAEESLIEAKFQYQNLVENLSDGIVLCAMDETITQVNSRLCEMLNRPGEEILGKRSYEVLLEENEYSAIIERTKCRLKGIPENYELFVRRADGSRFWCKIKATPVYNDSGIIIGSMATLSDISERKAAEEESARLQRELLNSHKLHAVGEISKGIASEISTTLGVIAGRIQLLNLPDQSSELRQATTRLALEQCQNSQNILKQLIELSQTSRGKPEVASPTTLVTETLKFVRGFLGANVELLHNHFLDDSKIEIDSSQFRHILITAILATKKVNGKRGKIVISHRKRTVANSNLAQKFSVIRIDDLSASVSANNLQRLMLPRFGEGQEVREASLALSSLTSTMLGLNGLVDITQLQENGVRIELSLPVYEKRLVSIKQQDERLENNARKVLVIDDEEMLVKLLQRFLEMSNIQSKGYSNPQHALSWFKENHADIALVVLDLKMSCMDGRECFAKMMEINPRVRVGFLSGFVEKEVEEDLLKQGALRFFQKPLRYPDLVDWVRYAMTTEH